MIVDANSRMAPRAMWETEQRRVTVRIMLDRIVPLYRPDGNQIAALNKENEDKSRISGVKSSIIMICGDKMIWDLRM